MIQNLYAIKDTKAGFNPTFIEANDFTAMRSVKRAMSDPKSDINIFAEDYELWCVGTYDTETGILCSKLNHLINLIDLKSTSKDESVQ